MGVENAPALDGIHAGDLAGDLDAVVVKGMRKDEGLGWIDRQEIAFHALVHVQAQVAREADGKRAHGDRQNGQAGADLVSPEIRKYLLPATADHFRDRFRIFSCSCSSAALSRASRVGSDCLSRSVRAW